MDRYLEPRIQKILETLQDVAQGLGKSMAQVALRWILEQEGITSVIVGSTKVEQLRDNIGCSGWNLPADALARLSEVSAPPMRYPDSMELNIHERRASAVDMPTLET